MIRQLLLFEMGQTQPVKIQYGEFIGEAKENETKVLRHPEFVNKPLPETYEERMDTLWKVFENSVKKYPNNRMLGTRKKINKNEYGEYEYKTYKEIHTEVIEFATGVSLLGLCPEVETRASGKFKFMGIYSRNREEWMVTDIASHMNSISLVTFYDSLGDSTIEFILSETNLTTIAMETTNLFKINALKEKGKSYSLKNLVLLDNDLPEEIEKSKKLGLNIFSFDDVIKKGRGQKVEFTNCKPETLATLSYTSGTTGTPKGTMLTHKQLAAQLITLDSAGMKLDASEYYLSYLPLAHVFERVINLFCMYIGATVGFYSGSNQRVVEDAKILKPTVFISVPRVMLRVYEKIIDNVKKSGEISKIIFEKALKDKLENLHKTGEYTHPLWDRLVFNKIKSSLGGNCKLIVIASAPINPDIVEVLKVCFCCPVILGYGQTEVCGAAFISNCQDNMSNHVGGPIKSLEIKLRDVPELNYTSKDVNPETGLPEPRGEILMRGPIVFKGYLNDKENTEKSFTKDGWLLTGDVGIILPQQGNTVKIIDRVKSIFKLSQGEYIAPEKIENVLSKSPYIHQVYVTGLSEKSFVVCVIVPEREAIIEFLKTQNITCNKDTVKNYYKNEILLKEIITSLDTLGRSNGLKGFEVVKRVLLVDEPFTIENNLITPTLKLKRTELKKKFSNDILALYSS